MFLSAASPKRSFISNHESRDCRWNALSLAPAVASARAAQRIGKEMRVLAAGYSARTANHWHRLQEKPIYLGEQRRVSVPVACAVPSAVLFERPPSGVQISAGDSGLYSRVTNRNE